MMEQDKKQLLMEQITKISEVIETLSVNFADVSEDEINFLEVTKKGLEELIGK